MVRSQISRSLRAIVLVAVLTFCDGSAFAEINETVSADFAMPGCRNYVSQNAREGDAFKKGFCLGLVSSLGYMNKDICLLPGVTQPQAIRVVVEYIDARPSRLHEDFRKLAVEALKAAWPCEKINYHLK